LGLLGMLGLVLAVERGVARRALDLCPAVYTGWAQSARAARVEAPKSDVVCLGDSQLKMALVPRVVESITGRGAYNLSLMGGRAPSTYFLLRRTLAAGARPSAVLVDFNPNLLATSPGEPIRPWAILLNTPECLDLAWTARDARLGGAIAMARLFPSVRLRDDVRSNLLGALRGRGSRLRVENLAYLRNAGINRGATIVRENPLPRGAPAASAMPPAPSTPWTCHPTNADYIERLLALLSARNIPVYWLLPPFEPWLQDWRDRHGLEARLDAYLRGLQARHPNLVIVDARRSGYIPTTFFDTGHLGYRGALAFSADVAQVLRDRSPRSELSVVRWVVLPRYGDRVVAATVEELSQSRAAVRTIMR
jgi:hypothetical protein